MQHAAKQVRLHVLLPATVITPSCVSRQQPRRPIEARVARKRIRHIRCTIRNPEPRRFKNKSGRRTADRLRHRRRIKRRRRLDIANQSARHIDRTRAYSLIRTMPAFDPIGSPQVSIIAQNICFLLAPTATHWQISAALLTRTALFLGRQTVTRRLSGRQQRPPGGTARNHTGGRRHFNCSPRMTKRRRAAVTALIFRAVDARMVSDWRLPGAMTDPGPAGKLWCQPSTRLS